jgi:aspartate-semialdehyde dehydrogenase
VNPHALKGHQGIIANPNCSTIIMVTGITPIHRLSPIRRIVASTYQAASGAGAKAMDVLRREIRGETVEKSMFPHRLAGNLIPRIDVLLENGYTKEEMKMVNETRKIMELPAIPISATCVRVPVERAHSESVQVTTERPLSLVQIREALSKASGVTLLDDAAKDIYPTPLQVSHQDDVYVGRVRLHPSEPNTYDLWIVGDQIRKGAALNAVQIAELLYR